MESGGGVADGRGRNPGLGWRRGAASPAGGNAEAEEDLNSTVWEEIIFSIILLYLSCHRYMLFELYFLLRIPLLCYNNKFSFFRQKKRKRKKEIMWLRVVLFINMATSS